MTQTPPAFFVGNIPIYGDLILAPMDGVTDQPFRSLCRQMGSAMSYSEFINAMDILSLPKLFWRVKYKLAFLPEERPVVYQVFDSDPDHLLEAGLRLHEYGPDIIDINMGCSVKAVTKRGAGAGLLRTPQKIAAIFSKLSSNLPVPVTGKIRLGWDEDMRNYIQVAKVIEENGGALIAVHARTRSQGYRGDADWDAIAEVKQAVSIPVIGNGDVRSVADIERLKEHTHCDGVMIGRGAIGNPWLFSRQSREQISPRQIQATILNHLERMISFYGDEQGLLLFRKHAKRYLSQLHLGREQHLELLTVIQPELFIKLLDLAVEAVSQRKQTKYPETF
jgi:tRNA-dihydrouridine synthase B